jgi:hypothetical protein
MLSPVRRALECNRLLISIGIMADVEEIRGNSTGAEAAPTQGWVGRNWKWILVLFIAALAVSRFSLHLGYVDQDKNVAAKLIEQFHERINAGRFEEIYDDAHPAFRNALSKQDWLRHMQENRDHYGLFRAAKSSKLNVIMGNPVQIRAAYVSTFDKGDATELFSFAREGQKVQLLIYGISPGDTRVGSGSAQKTE